MTRITALVCAALALLLTQALAQDWTPFGIRRFGFIFDVPPGFFFVRNHKEDAGEGALFQNPEGDFVVVWGINVDIRDFPSAVEELMQKDEDDGWDLTYQQLTPKWAAYSGVRDDRIKYVKSISVCGGRAAFFLAEYNRAAKRDYDPIVAQMEKSLKREGC